MALGSTVTGKSNFFWDISLQTLDSLAHVGFFWGNPCKDIHPVKTSGIDCQKMAFEQELAPHWPVCLQSSCSDSAECKFEKSLGFQNMCHRAIDMEHKLIHGQWVIFETLVFITHK